MATKPKPPEQPPRPPPPPPQPAPQVQSQGAPRGMFPQPPAPMHHEPPHRPKPPRPDMSIVEDLSRANAGLASVVRSQAAAIQKLTASKPDEGDDNGDDDG